MSYLYLILETFLFRTRPIAIVSVTEATTIKNHERLANILTDAFIEENRDRLFECLRTQLFEDCCQQFSSSYIPEFEEFCTVSDMLNLIEYLLYPGEIKRIRRGLHEFQPQFKNSEDDHILSYIPEEVGANFYDSSKNYDDLAPESPYREHDYDLMDMFNDPNTYEYNDLSNQRQNNQQDLDYNDKHSGGYVNGIVPKYLNNEEISHIPELSHPNPFRNTPQDSIGDDPHTSNYWSIPKEAHNKATNINKPNQYPESSIDTNSFTGPYVQLNGAGINQMVNVGTNKNKEPYGSIVKDDNEITMGASSGIDDRVTKKS